MVNRGDLTGTYRRKCNSRIHLGIMEALIWAEGLRDSAMNDEPADDGLRDLAEVIQGRLRDIKELLDDA